jgi:hypothetical protein
MTKVNRLFNVMKECHRLRSAPQLFPSTSARREFFCKIAIMSKNLLRFKYIIEHQRKYISRVKEHFRNNVKGPKLVKKVGGIWFRVKPYGTGTLKNLHPGGVDATRPWNHWLGNLAVRPPNGRLRVEISQRIPLIGLKILRRTKFMYGVVRRSYLGVSRFTKSKFCEADKPLIITIKNRQDECYA